MTARRRRPSAFRSAASMPASSRSAPCWRRSPRVLIVPISQAHYLMGRDPLLLSFIVVIIGGLGSLRGTVVAAVADRHVATASSRCSSRRRWPRSSPRCWSPWCWCSGRKACSGRRRDEATLSPAKVYALHLGVIALLFALQLPAAGLSSRPARPHHGAGGLRHGLQYAVRLCRPAQPRPCDVLRRRALRRRPRRHPARLERAAGLPRRHCLRRGCSPW